ncbi:MBOAT family O-acyltransferase [Microcoleus sp. bin38.metabat.b11b12b14.051]|uniref:MBOAT family O-acyltransferase n=1 Tax=Microcoleus sp. bin38.metabat.b11b12b14.051 TaxID=2742709 RepID=UPI0025DF4190|nr:MBOAT family O-acyltransferase [Microcoleus sp. bin38.metabat.b11b12b14.051]
MLFPTYQFLVFFLILFSAIISLKPQVNLYKVVLLVSSLLFYSFWSFDFLLLLVLGTVYNYIILRALCQGKYQKLALISGLIFNIANLGIFKYCNFFVTSLFDVLNQLKIPASFQVLQIIAPVGVSFYTFRMIAHLIDCYQHKIPCPKFVDYATYITYFPQIASGPISRPREFYVQLNSPKKYDYQIEEVIVLILSGLFKKYTLSSFLFNFTQLPFKVPQQYSSIDLILAAISYSCLIYVDFSGYSDLANGISCLLGFKPIPNFNMPYRSLSLQEFWKRWHISLSEWLRDYVYFPLGGNKYGKLRKYVNLLMTMAIGGFWHGAGLNFIFWGAIHGLGLIVNHLCKDIPQAIGWKIDSRFPRLAQFCSWLLTFTFVTCSWVFFGTPNWETAMRFFQGIFRFSAATVQFNFWQLYLVIAVIGAINLWGESISQVLQTVFSLKNLFFRVVLVSLFVYAILMLGPSTVPPFIYFNF